MRKFIFGIFIALLTLPVLAQQPTQAKVVLDKTAAAFRSAGGVKADFSVQAFTKGRSVGTSTGVIQLKGEKFVLKTADMITWFDGKTQWSYLKRNDEVNISVPTQEEQQAMNPYALLAVYQKGFAYKLGSVKTFQGKSVYEVILTATTAGQDLSSVILYVTKDTYRPLYISVALRDKSRSEITITGYQSGQRYADSVFVFDKKAYPHAEIIDLR